MPKKIESDLNVCFRHETCRYKPPKIRKVERLPDSMISISQMEEILSLSTFIVDIVIRMLSPWMAPYAPCVALYSVLWQEIAIDSVGDRGFR